MLHLPKTNTQTQLEAYGFQLLPNHNNAIQQYYMSLRPGFGFILFVNDAMCSLYMLTSKDEQPISKLFQTFTRDTLQQSLSKLLAA